MMLGRPAVVPPSAYHPDQPVPGSKDWKYSWLSVPTPVMSIWPVPWR
jgi:hypothetical protein